MNEWTDERLAAVLSATFTAHETEADPVVARRIALAAGKAPRRRWIIGVAAAAAAIVAVSVTIHGIHQTVSKPGAVSVSAPPPVPAGHNRALAVAEANRLSAEVPVPPGASKVTSAPAPRLRHLGAQIDDVDPSLTRTSWWVVPTSYRDLVAWYDAHTPADLASSYLSSGSVASTGDLYWQMPDPAPAAYTRPAIVVSYVRLDAGRTALRTDVTLAARYARTAATIVPARVRSIQVTKRTLAGVRTPPETGTSTDPSVVAKAASAFNALRGAPAHALPPGCGSPAGAVYTYAVTFRWPGHTLAVDPGEPLCGIGMSLIRDGTRLPQRLEQDDALDHALQAVLDGS